MNLFRIGNNDHLDQPRGEETRPCRSLWSWLKVLGSGREASIHVPGNPNDDGASDPIPASLPPPRKSHLAVLSKDGFLSDSFRHLRGIYRVHRLYNGQQVHR